MVEMKIFVKTLNSGVGHQIIDAWNSYKQYQHDNKNLTQYTLADSLGKFNKEEYNLTILLDYVHGTSVAQHNINEYDLVLICNSGEPINVATPVVKQLLTYKNVFLIGNSYLSDACEVKDKVIWFPDDVMTCRDYWTRHFYPQYYDLHNHTTDKKTNTLFYINGANRTTRQLFMDYLQELNLDITIKNNITDQICEIGESQWESAEDTDFRVWVNQQYPHSLIENFTNNYYSNSITVGINNRFGQIPPGYFHLPLYFEHACVIFPESNWQNNELSITEKALKCFYAESLPMPIAGANVNRLYNEVGFYTAWNLLPAELQSFDGILDHKLRYRKLSYAIKWLTEHPEVFDSKEYKDMTHQNKINFLTCKCDYLAVVKFDQLLQKFIR